LKNTLTHGITKEQHITQSLLYRWELGTVENTLTHGITKEQHITQSLLHRWNCRTVEIIPKHDKESQRAAHHSIPAS
jgi:formyltetrahydrofolate hydrolase